MIKGPRQKADHEISVRIKMIVQRKKEREGRGKRKKEGRRERDFTYNEQGN